MKFVGSHKPTLIGIIPGKLGKSDTAITVRINYSNWIQINLFPKKGLYLKNDVITWYNVVPKNCDVSVSVWAGLFVPKSHCMTLGKNIMNI